MDIAWTEDSKRLAVVGNSTPAGRVSKKGRRGENEKERKRERKTDTHKPPLFKFEADMWVMYLMIIPHAKGHSLGQWLVLRRFK